MENTLHLYRTLVAVLSQHQIRLYELSGSTEPLRGLRALSACALGQIPSVASVTQCLGVSTRCHWKH